MLSDVRTYVRDRILIPKIVVWIMLVSFGLWVVSQLVLAPVIALLFVTGFRLMDDLADRPHDAVAHPARCLVRTRYLPVFVALDVVLIVGLAGLVAITAGPERGVGIFVLALGLCVVTMGRRYQRTAIAAVVLLKYPAVILLVATDPLGWATLATAGVFYVIPLADEVRG